MVFVVTLQKTGELLIYSKYGRPFRTSLILINFFHESTNILNSQEMLSKMKEYTILSKNIHENEILY